MRTIRDELLQIIEDLPLYGRLYTAMHNLWGVFFCAVGTGSRTRLHKILDKLEYNTESVGFPRRILVYVTNRNSEYISSINVDP
jgi:hypothetical protein